MKLKSIILGLASSVALATTEVDLGGTFVEAPKVELGVCQYAITDEHSVEGTRCLADEMVVGRDEARFPALLRCGKLRITCPIINCRDGERC